MFDQIAKSIPPQIYTYLTPVAIILAALLLGILIEKLVLRNLIRLAAKTKWKGDDAIFKSFKGILFIWVACVGVYYASAIAPIPADTVLIIRQILVLIAIATFTILASRAAIAMVNVYAVKIRGIFASTSIFTNITKILIFIIGFLIALQTLGISVAPILAALGVGGLAVALALQDSLNNLFSGLYIIASRQVKPGDFIKLENGEQGYIEDITWRNTTIRSLAKYLIIMPNAKLAQAIVVNYSQTGKELTVIAEIPLSYDNDLARVEKVTLEVASDVMKTVPGGIPDFVPHMRFSSFNDTNIKLSVLLHGKQFVDQYLLKHEFMKRLHERYKIEGIKLKA